MKYLKLKFLLMFFALAMAIPPAWAGTVYQLLTDASQLEAGKTLIIASVKSDNQVRAMYQQTSNNFSSTIVNVTANNTITAPGNAHILTLEGTTNKWNFKTMDNKYLYAASSSNNYLRSKDNIDESGNSNATIVTYDNGISEITFQGNYTRKYLKYNSGSQIFSCYSGGQQDVYIYIETEVSDTYPSITITPPSLDINQNGGVFTVKAANMPNNGLGALIDSSSPSNAFSFTKTNDNTFNDVDNFFPLTGNANNKYDLESGTVQVNYTGHALSAAGVIKFASGSESATADVNYLYDGDIYIVGDVEGSGWSTEGDVVHGVPLVKNADGTYSVTVTATAGGEGFSWLYFTKSIDAPNYDALGDNRFGPVSNDANWSYNSDLNGVYCDLDTEGNLHTIKMSPGNYIFTIDPANNKFKIEAVAGPKIYNKVTDASQLIAGKKYILVYEKTPAFMGGIPEESSYGLSITGPSISENSVNIGQYGNIRELTLSGDANGWLFHNGDGYLSWPTGNALSVDDDETDDYSKWTVSYYENSTKGSGYILTNVSDDTRVLQYNSSANPKRFACYTGTQMSAVLYVEDGVEPVLPTVVAPTILPEEREFLSSVEVSMTCATAGATIYYTVDGTEPTTSSTAYAAPFTLNATTTVKAIAVLGNETSQVVTATFTKTGIETIAKAQALPTSGANANFTFVGSAVVTFHNGNHLYIRDGSGSGLIYGVNAETKKYNNGDVLTPGWKAKNDVYQVHTPEFTNPSGVGSTANNGTIAPEMLNSIQLTDVNKYAGFNNVTITRSEEQSGKMNYYCSVGESKQEVCLRRAYTDLVGELTVGKKYNVTGVVTIYRSGSSSNYTYTPQLNLISATIVKEDLTLGFDPASVPLYVGQAFTAPALTGVPEGETIDVTYTSDNTNVATVVDNVVTLVEGATGTATITANFAGNDYYNPTTATYTITVNEKLAHGMSFSAETLNVTYGDEDYEAPTLNNPNSLTVTYESDNEDVAVVDENTGELLLGDAGTAVITAKTKGDASHNGGSVSYTVNIAKAAAGLAYETAQYTVYAGQDFEAPTLTNPNKLTVTYESDNEDVAVVDETGDVLIGEKVGDAKITAKFEGNKNYEAGSASYTIHVIAKDNVTMSFDPTSVTLYVDEEFAQPTLTTNPANLPVKYSSDNEEVAMVDETSGEVLLMEKAGTATITAKYAGNDQYNEASATYTITVENRPEILIDDESLDLGTTGEGEIFVMASDLKENVTVTSSNENFKVEPPTITPEQAANGVNVTVTYTGNNPEGESTTITFSTKDGEDVKVTVTAKAETYVNIAAPTFAPAAGTYTEPKEVAIACATPGVTITYAIDGVDKGEYNGPFTISDGEHTVTATAMMGTRTVYTPATSSATYTINAASAATIADDYYSLQSNAAEVSGKYANVAGRRTLNFVADADKQAGTVFRIETGEGGAVKTLRSQAVDLQGYANRAMAYVPKVIDLVLSTLANSSLGDPETPGTGILGENGLDLILNKFYEGFDYNLYVEEGTEGTYRIYGRTPSMQHVVDFYHENTAQVEEKLPMLEGYINQVLDKIRNKIPAPYDANVVVPFSLKTVRDRIADKYGITLIDPTQDLMGFYRQVLNNKEYVWDFAYQTAMMYVDVIKETQTYKNLPDEYKLYVTKMEKVRPDTKYYIIERGNELDYISENNGEIISNDPRTLWTLTKRVNFTVNVPEANKLNDSYYTTLYTDFGYELPTGVNAYAVTGIDENDVAQLTEITGAIPAQTPVLLKADAAGDKVLTLKKESRGGAIEGNLLEGPDYLITKYQIKTPAVVSLFNMAQGFVPADVLADYEYLQLRYSGTVNNKYFWNVNSDLEDLQGDCVVRSLAVKNGTLAFSEHWTTETNKAFLVSDTKPVIYLEKETLAAPTFSPVPGSYTVNNGESVTITITAEDGATIYYKIGDGEYQRYNGPITASDDMTIVAKAEKDGMIASDEVTAVYVIDIPAELPDVPVMKGYFQIMNNGNEKYAHVQGRKTLTFTDAPADKAGTVIWLETNEKGQVLSLRSQAADLQRYADRVVEYYVPKAVELVVEKLHADGASNILGENGLDAIMDKFNESFDHHLYVEPAEGGYRIYGKTPSMQPVVDFYREHTAQVEAKLPMLESFINSALDKLKETIGGGSTIFKPFSLLNIWERMGGTLTKPEDDASIMAFYREVLNNKNYVWDFAYQTATFYLENLKNHQRWPEVEAMMGEYAQYFNKLEQVRPDFKYYIVTDGEKPDFISEGNVDIINNEARTIWTVEPRTTFTVNIPENNKLGGGYEYVTTLYTDFAYDLPEGVTAYKVTGVSANDVAELEAIEGTIPAQTPVLLKATTAGDKVLTLNVNDGTIPTDNLLVGPDFLINYYGLTTPQLVSLFQELKEKLGEDFYNNYVKDYEYLMKRNSGTVNNKYFWNVNADLDEMTDEPIVRDLAVDENGKLAFSDHWTTENNKAFLVDTLGEHNVIYLSLRGDINRDGLVNISDVTALIDILLELEPYSYAEPSTTYPRGLDYEAADVNLSGARDITDVTVLIDIILSKFVQSSTNGN